MSKIRFPDYIEDTDVRVRELVCTRDWQRLSVDNEARLRRLRREVDVDDFLPPRRKPKRLRDHAY